MLASGPNFVVRNDIKISKKNFVKANEETYIKIGAVILEISPFCV
jgi:hypothetical protein